MNSGYAPAVGRAPDVAQGPSALRERFPGCNCAPALGVPSKKLEISSLLTRIRPRRNPCRPPQVGAAAHTCTESAARTAPAKHAQASQPLPFRTPAIFRQRALPARSRPPRRGHSHRRKQGGAGGIISDLANRKRARRPVCARHAVRTAGLVRRALRLTAEVNSACLCPSAGLLMSPGAPEH